MSNIKEIKTTITGLLIAFGSIAYGALPFLSQRNDLWAVNGWYVIGGIVCGILLVIAPDRLLSIAFGWLKKQADK